METRRTVKGALIRLAALAGLLNLAGCLGSTTAPPLPALGVVAYSADFQRRASIELGTIATEGGACYSPHIIALIVDYKALRDTVRTLNPSITGVRGSADEQRPQPPEGTTANAEH